MSTEIVLQELGLVVLPCGTQMESLHVVPDIYEVQKKNGHPHAEITNFDRVQ
jgi:hypothetical protein